MELSLVLPVLLILTAGVLEWGRIVAAEVGMTQVARDAALAGARTGRADDPAGVARTRAEAAATAAGLDRRGLEVVVGETTVDGAEALVVTVRAPYVASVPLVPVPATISATLTARLEDQ